LTLLDHYVLEEFLVEYWDFINWQKENKTKNDTSDAMQQYMDFMVQLVTFSQDGALPDPCNDDFRAFVANYSDSIDSIIGEMVNMMSTLEESTESQEFEAIMQAMSSYFDFLFSNVTCNQTEPSYNGTYCPPFMMLVQDESDDMKDCEINTTELLDFLTLNDDSILPSPKDLDYWDWIGKVSNETSLNWKDLDEWVWAQWENFV